MRLEPHHLSATLLVIFLSMPGITTAGAYILAEGNNDDFVTHPNTYTGNGGNINVRVCIDPTSPNATDMETSVQNNLQIYNMLIPTYNNSVIGSGNNVPSNAIDFESVALHEIGHCLGLAHVNAASESGLPTGQIESTKAQLGPNGSLDVGKGTDGVYGSADDNRGDDINLHYFRKSNNDPFTIESIVDSTTYSRQLSDLPAGDNFAANASRQLAADLGYGDTEAVMQQGSYYNEAQRTLNHDDVATLQYAKSGLNETVDNTGNSDDYTITMIYGGISTSNCDISLSFTTTTSLAFCSVSGAYVDAPPNFTHLKVQDASIEFGQSYNWFFNDVQNHEPSPEPYVEPVMTETDTPIVYPYSAVDADGDAVVSITASGLPAFASLVDNGDGTSSLTVSPLLGDAGVYPVTLDFTDDGTPALTRTINIDITVDALDTDGDGLGDFDEINTYSTDPALVDTDGDGLSDFDEVITYQTDPNLVDTDGDYIDDGTEIALGSDPLLGTDWPAIADGDLAPLGTPDGLINAADLLIAGRIVTGDLTATSLELAHGDVYPAGTPDGVIDASDLLLIRALVLP